MHRPRVRWRYLAAWAISIISGSLLVSITLHSRQGTGPASDATGIGVDAARLAKSLDGRGPEAQDLALRWTHASRTAPAAANSVRLRFSPADSAFIAGSGGDYTALLDGTEAALARWGFEVTRHGGVPGPEDPAWEILCCPFAYCWSAAEWDSLLGWIESGGAFLAIGPIGVRDDAGQWRGWDRMLELTQATEAWEVPFEHSGFITLAAASPVIPADLHGARFALDRGPSAIGLASSRPSGGSSDASTEISPHAPWDAPSMLAWWSDYGRRPLRRDAPGAMAASGATAGPGGVPWSAAMARSRASGRILWLGFPLEWVHESASNDAIAASWLQSGVAWIRNDGISADLTAWPSAAPFATLVEVDTEAAFENAGGIADALDLRGLRATFFCVSDLASGNPGVVERIAANHEIGSHTDNHAPVGGLAHKQQRTRLERSAKSLAELSGARVEGFRPPEERFDASTLRALVDAGYDYMLRDGESVLASPRVYMVPGGSVVSLPRLARDDYGLIEKDRRDAARIDAALFEDFEAIRGFGGLFTLSLHTQVAGSPEFLSAFEPSMDRIAAAPAWRATGSEIADWWRTRSACLVECRTAGWDPDPVWEVRLHNRGDRAAEGLVLRFAAPRPDGTTDTNGHPVVELVTTGARDGSEGPGTGPPGIRGVSPETVASRWVPAPEPDRFESWRVGVPPIPAESEIVLRISWGPSAARAALDR